MSSPTPTTSKDKGWSIPSRGQDTSVRQAQPQDDLEFSWLETFTISRDSRKDDQVRTSRKNSNPHIAGWTESNKACEGGIKTPKSLELSKTQRNNKYSPVTSKSIKRKNNADDVTVDVNEDKNDNDIITIDEDYDFDFLMPTEELLDFSENDPEVDKVSENRCPAPHLNVPTALRPVCPTTSSDVIRVDDFYANTNTLNPFSMRPTAKLSTRPVLRTNNNIATSTVTSQSDQVIEVPEVLEPNPFSTRPTAKLSTRPVLRTNNNIATSTVTSQSDQVIEVPDVLEPINMSRRAPVSRPAAWNEDVQFVSELRPPSPSPSTSALEAAIVIQQYARIFEVSFNREYGDPAKRIHKRAKVNDNIDTRGNNEAPATENTITVNQQVQTSDNDMLSPRSGRQLGECPICYDNLDRAPIASTHCGHVFCLECIKQSMKTRKRCPTCQKHLKSRGYHQVYL